MGANILRVVAVLLWAQGCEFGGQRAVPLLPAMVVMARPTPDESRQYWVRYYARKFQADEALLLRISYRENHSAQRDAWSPTHCCVGVMQVHVDWLGSFDEVCGGSDLLTVKNNTCYGVQIWLWHLKRREGDVRGALADYGGFQTADPSGYIADIHPQEE